MVSKVVTGFLCIFSWLHGATVGVALGDSLELYTFFLWTLGAFLIISTMWMHSPEMRRIAASLTYLFCCTFLVSLVKSIGWFRTPKLEQWTSLPDIGHDIFANSFLSTPTFDIPFYGPIRSSVLTNFFLIVIIFSTAFFIGCHSMRNTIVRRFLMIYSTLMLSRAIMAGLTFLPDSNPECHQADMQIIDIRIVVRRMLQSVVPALVADGTGCRDIIFAGHTNILILCAMTWHTYYKWVPTYVNKMKTVVWICVFIVVILSLAQRQNYTLDIVLASYFSITTWATYHRLVNDVITGHAFSCVWLIDKVLVYPLIEWMEEVVIHEKEKETENLVRLYRCDFGLSPPRRRRSPIQRGPTFRTSYL